MSSRFKAAGSPIGGFRASDDCGEGGAWELEWFLEVGALSGRPEMADAATLAD